MPRVAQPRCAAMPRTQQQAETHEKRLRDGLNRLGLLAYRYRQRAQAHGTATKSPDQRLQDPLINAIQAQSVDLIQLQGSFGRCSRHNTVAMDLSPVTHPTKKSVRDSWSAATTSRNFFDSHRLDGDGEQAS